MANVLSLALKINADASGLKLDPVQRALVNLGNEADKLTGVFDKFKGSSAGAAAAQEQVAAKTKELIDALRDNGSATQFAADFEKLTQSVKEQAAAFERGIEVTQRYTTDSERRAAQLAELKRLVDLNAISEEIYGRAVADVSGANAAAAEAEKQRAATLAEADRQRQATLQEGIRLTEQFATAEEKRTAQIERVTQLRDQGAISEETYQRALAELTGENERAAAAEAEREKFLQRAAQLTQAVVTPMQAYDAAVQELNTHIEAGTITQDVYDKNLAEVTANFVKAESAAQGYDKAVDDAGKGGTLAFNELSGILAAIPGPIGNIAGRLSGLSSATEGLGRIFQGGLSGGVTSLVTSVAQLANPLTIAVAAIAAFGAAATAITNGLVQLSGRVESLTLLSQRLGTSFEFTQTLEEAAKRTGGSVEELAGSMQKFATRVDDARSGSGKAAEAFAELGISQEQLRNSNPAELAAATAEALKKIEDPARRAALATDTLGKQGLALIPAFASLGDAEQAMTRFSSAISDIDAERLNSLDDSFDNVATALQGLGQNLLTPFVGLADGVASAIADAIGGLTNLLEPALDAITPILDGVGAGFRELGEVIYALASGAGAVLQAFSETFGRVSNVISTAITQTIGFVGSLATRFGEFTGIGSTISTVASNISSAFQSLWSNITEIISGIGGFIEQVLTFAEDWLGIKATIEEPITAQINTDQLDEAEAVSQEFKKTLDSVSERLNQAIEESAQFGKAGFDAALKYQEALKEIQRQFDQGIINEAAYRTAIDNATESYEGQIDAIKRAQDEATKRAEAERAAAQKIIDDNKRIADQLLEQLDIDQQFGGDSGRAKAAANVKALTEEIARVEAEIEAARRSGDAAAVTAGAARLARLDQARAREEDIASGAAAARDAAAKAQEEAAKEQERIDQEKQRRQEQLLEQEMQANLAIFEAQQKYNDALYEVEKERIEELNTLRGGAVSIADIRNGGAGIFLDLAGGREDPAIAEYRQQLKELKALRSDINKLVAQKAEILGGVG